MSRVSFGGVEPRTYAQQAAAAEESEDLTGAAAGAGAVGAEEGIPPAYVVTMELQMAAMKQRQERMETRVEALERDKARLEARVDELEHARVESAPVLAPEQDEPKPLLAFGYIEEIELLAHICSFLASKDLGRLVCVSASFGRKTDWQRSEEGGGTQQLSVMEEVARRWVAARPAEEQAWAPDGSWLQRMHVIQRHDGLVQEGLRCWLDAAHYGSVDAGNYHRVRSWQDRSGNGIHAVPLDGLNGTYDGNTPHFIAKATINGLPALSFGKRDSLKAARGCRVRTIAIVAQHRTVSHCMMLFSHYKNKDFSLRVESAHGYRRAGSTTGGRIDGNDWHHGKEDKLWLNGSADSRKWAGFPTAPVVVIADKRDGRGDGDDFVYQLSSRFMDRGFDGLIGEVLVYDRELSDEERVGLNRYLSTKWKTAAA
jgi:hypothetical protein